MINMYVYVYIYIYNVGMYPTWFLLSQQLSFRTGNHGRKLASMSILSRQSMQEYPKL